MNYEDDKFLNVAGKIYSTTDYSLFKILEGNRGIKPSRVAKIKSSINKVGYIQSPIVINSKFEIIDGQGRFTALKELNLPIEYVVAPNAGIKECISMNINAEKWTMQDYINSFASRGYQSYIRLRDLMTTYKVPLNVASTALFNVSKIHPNIIHDGNLEITDETLENAKKRLNQMLDIFNQIDSKYLKNTKTLLQQALLYVLSFEEVDYNRLYKSVTHYLTVPNNGWSTVESVIYDIEHAYNLNLSSNNVVMIYNIYRELMKRNGLRGVIAINKKGGLDE